MSTEYKEKYQCPECESEIIRYKFKVKNNDKNSAYANVTEEIQCATCFMDIPANVFVINKGSNIEENKTINFTFEIPNVLKDKRSLLFFNLIKAHIEDKNKIKGNMLNTILGIIINDNCIGRLIPTSYFLK